MKKMRCTNLTVIALISTFLSACMMGPNYHSPVTPHTQTYTAAALSKRTVSTPDTGQGGTAQTFVYGRDIPAEWWKLFHSSAIDALVRQGIANSPNLAAAKATLHEAQETLRAQTGNLLLPSVNGNAGAQRKRTDSSTIGIEGSNPSIFNLYNASVNVSYTLDMFGGLRRQIEVLQAQTDYQANELLAAYLTLTSNIVTSAITAASLEAQIHATQQLIQSQTNQLAIVKQQFHLGGTSQTGVLTQTIQLAQTRATLPPLEKNLAQTQHALAVLIGELPSESCLPHFDLTQLTLPTQLPINLPSALVQQRPDVRASAALLHAASAQVGVATANLFPQITLTGSYGWSSTSPSNLFGPESAIWNLASGLTQPIFHGAALRSQRQAAIAAYEAAAAQYKQTVLQAFQNVADSLRALETDAQTLHAQQLAETSAHRTLRLTQQQYQLGGVSYLALLNAQQQYQQAHIQRIQAQAARYSDTAALFQALGGGWWKDGNNL